MRPKEQRQEGKWQTQYDLHSNISCGNRARQETVQTLEDEE